MSLCSRVVVSSLNLVIPWLIGESGFPEHSSPTLPPLPLHQLSQQRGVTCLSLPGRWVTGDQGMSLPRLRSQRSPPFPCGGLTEGDSQ